MKWQNYKWNPIVLKAFLDFGKQTPKQDPNIVEQPKTKQFSEIHNGEHPLSSRESPIEGYSKKVESTAIEKASHDGKNTAKIIFTSGPKEYHYRVTPAEFEDFLNSPSKGNHVATIWNHNPHFRKPGF